MKPLCDGGRRTPAVMVKEGYIEERCSCGETCTVADKGLGRATLAAWKSRHQPPKEFK